MWCALKRAIALVPDAAVRLVIFFMSGCNSTSWTVKEPLLGSDRGRGEGGLGVDWAPNIIEPSGSGMIWIGQRLDWNWIVGKRIEYD